jgi:hypothetical protein
MPGQLEVELGFLFGVARDFKINVDGVDIDATTTRNSGVLAALLIKESSVCNCDVGEV